MQLDHTAHHEAGHAVIGRVMGLTCGGATIEPDYDDLTAGHSKSHVERSINDWDARGRCRCASMFRARIMMLMAGREAEIVCLGGCGGGDGDDLLEIDISLDETEAPEDPEPWLSRLRIRTRDRVVRHSEAIKAVAAALLARKTVKTRRTMTPGSTNINCLSFLHFLIPDRGHNRRRS
jgi:hypothetical protein